MRLTDAGLETVLVFEEGIDLSQFAAFPLVDDENGRTALRRYYEPFIRLAQNRKLELVLQAPTWRASPDWGRLLGYDEDDVAGVNRRAVALVEAIRDDALPTGERETVVVEAGVGPRADAYRPAFEMDAGDAERYHARQLRALSDSGCAQACALTLTYAEEAIGIVRAAKKAELPVVVGFTVETDGRLPNGSSIEDAITAVDEATDGAAEFFVINCAHPTHFADALPADETASRIRGIRANASTRSHAELDEAEELAAGDPTDLAARYVALRERLPALEVLGGCGTNIGHVTAIADAWLASE